MPLSAGKKYCGHDNVFIFDRIFVILADNKDRHKYLNEFDFRPDRNIFFRVTRPLASTFSP